VETNCRHFYHVRCLSRWYFRNKTCPQCRLRMDPKVKFACIRCKAFAKEMTLVDI
jgi:hypothetical protein